MGYIVDLIRAYQLNVMLLLCGVCGTMVCLLLMTRFLSESRKRSLIIVELLALFLLFFDRLSYIYRGDPSHTGYIMVRLSNFFVFFLTSGIVFGFNIYLSDYLMDEGKMRSLPFRLKAVGSVSVLGMALAVIAAFSNLYYYFDEANVYHRSRGFLIAYIIPVVCPLIQYTVIREYKKVFGKLIYISLALYIFVPIICGILQIFAYGISMVNIAISSVSIALYIFAYIDMNDTVERAHKIEIQNMQNEKVKMQRLFDQTAKAFVSAIEKRDDFNKGNAVKIANYAKQIAQLSGKEADECERVYYTALLHDVGMIGIPDRVIKGEADPTKEDYELMRQKPIIGREILSSITEYPYLSVGAYYSHERYDGTGYPEGIKGEDIPEIARIVAVADAYVTMTTKKRYREARPDFVAREEFIKGGGVKFDPKFADIMVGIIDANSADRKEKEIEDIETSLLCDNYRDNISKGILADSSVSRITFDCSPYNKTDRNFSLPSVILFKSYDGRVHDNKRAIEAYKYLEYAEVWFDEHNISTAARKIEQTIEKTDQKTQGSTFKYEIEIGRYEDHIRVNMTGPLCKKTLIAALPAGSDGAYIALTGEHCNIQNICVTKTGETLTEGDVPRIAEKISYIDRMESDLKNIQIENSRAIYSEGVEIKHNLKINFHTMSLPAASFVWHCPYLLLFSSDDGSVNSAGYREYALIKLCGEREEKDKFAKNSFIMKKTEDFAGWDRWKEINKQGLECEVSLTRRGSRVTLKTTNLGIYIENTTVVSDSADKIYAALTGEQCAITDIRVRGGIS